MVKQSVKEAYLVILVLGVHWPVALINWATDPRQVNQVALGALGPQYLDTPSGFSSHTLIAPTLFKIKRTVLHIQGEIEAKQICLPGTFTQLGGKRFRDLELYRKLLILSFFTWRPSPNYSLLFAHLSICKCSNTKSAVEIAHNMEGIGKGISYLKGSELRIYVWRNT